MIPEFKTLLSLSEVAIMLDEESEMLTSLFDLTSSRICNWLVLLGFFFLNLTVFFLGEGSDSTL